MTETVRGLRKGTPLFVDQWGNTYYVIHKDSPTIAKAHELWQQTEVADRGGCLVCLAIIAKPGTHKAASTKSLGKLVKKKFVEENPPNTLDDNLLLGMPNGSLFVYASVRSVQRPKQRGPMALVALDNIRNAKTQTREYGSTSYDPDVEMTPDDDEKSVNVVGDDDEDL